MSFDIRVGTVEDLPTIYSFELAYIQEIEPDMESAWKNAVSLHLRQWIDNLARLFIAAQEGQMVGYCFWQREESSASLASLYVTNQARRCGVGSRLLRRFEMDAHAQGFTRLTLGVRVSNPAAALYRQAGYQWINKEGYYDVYEKIIPRMQPHIDA